jgi:phosphoribosylaminoimidazole-succinocarboxamide synthase
MADALFESSIKSLPLLGRGKVRDIYAVDDEKMLIVTTDRLSAFDVILPDPIPGKGKPCCTADVELFWFRQAGRRGRRNQLSEALRPRTVVTDAAERDQVEGRAMVVQTAASRCRSRRWCAAT